MGRRHRRWREPVAGMRGPRGEGLGGWGGVADASTSGPYLAGRRLICFIASKHLAGTHLFAMTQKSLQGGTPL
jgi:hypothetical protein